jgi:hypothetical protein
VTTTGQRVEIDGGRYAVALIDDQTGDAEIVECDRDGDAVTRTYGTFQIEARCPRCSSHALCGSSVTRPSTSTGTRRRVRAMASGSCVTRAGSVAGRCGLGVALAPWMLRETIATVAAR